MVRGGWDSGKGNGCKEYLRLSGKVRGGEDIP